MKTIEEILPTMSDLLYDLDSDTDGSKLDIFTTLWAELTIGLGEKKEEYRKEDVSLEIDYEGQVQSIMNGGEKITKAKAETDTNVIFAERIRTRGDKKAEIEKLELIVKAYEKKIDGVKFTIREIKNINKIPH